MADQDAKLEKVSYAKERELNSPNAVKQTREARSKKGLKVEIKLASAFVKKVSTVTDETVPSLIRDINEKLNLTRFVEEVVASLAQAPIKLKDVEAATALCSAMHRSYDEFTDPLVKSLIEQYDQACKSDDKADVARRRVLLRWLSELYMVGLADGDPQLILKIVRAATRAGSPPGPLPDPLPETLPPLPDQGCMNLQAVAVLLKAMGGDLMGSSSEYPPIAIRTKLLALFTAFAQGALARLREERSALRRVKRRVENESLKRGEVSEEASDALAKREKICDDLYQNCIVLCETLSLPKPPSPEELREEDEAKREAADQAIAEKVGLELHSRRKGGETDLSFEAWIFGDEATRAFYENLDDIVAVIPRAILEKPDQALQPSVIERLKASKDLPMIAPLETVTQLPPEGSDVAKLEEMDATGGSDEIDNPDAIQVNDDEDDNGENSSLKVESVNRPVEELMSKLPDMLTERLVENFARDFAHHNSKSARKRLVQELFNVPRGRTELLPYYARLAAILSKVYVGIGSILVDSIRGAFFRCTRDHRAGSRLNSRLRYTKYLGELVKFGLKCPELGCPPAAAFRALKQTMDFFQGENIDMACALVESCGREMYRTPRTHPEMARLLESLQRIRTARNLSPVHDALVDNAYYHCIPVDQNAALALVKQARRERSEIEKYVRYLLIDQLGADLVVHTSQEGQQKSIGGSDVEVEKKPSASKPPKKSSATVTLTPQETSTVVSLLRLPWNTNYEECEEAVSRAIIASCKHRAGTLPMVCQVLVIVTKRYPRLSVRVVEDLIETIVWGLDENDFRHSQRRIGQTKCLAHMLRVNLITPALYFDVLFMVLHRGHEKPASMLAQMGPIGGGMETIRSCAFGQTYRYHPAVPCVNDPPWDTFRIRLVCASLETAGERLLGSSILPRLELFVMYLERYVWNKSYVSIEVEFQMLDVLQDLERRLPAPKVTKGGRGRSSRRGGKHKVEASKVKLVGIAPTRQVAEDMIAAIEGKGFQSDLKVSDVIEEGDEEEEDEEDDNEEMDVEEEEEEEEDLDDEDEEEETVEEMKQQSVPRSKLPPPEPTPEDLAFEQEFAKLMKETLEQSGKSNLGGQALRGDNLVIPLGVMKKTTSTNRHVISSNSGETATTPSLVGGNGSGVALSLLKRGPNKKIEVKTLVVPEDSALAKASQMREDTIKEMREEEEAIKRLTLKAAAATTTRLREAGDF